MNKRQQDPEVFVAMQHLLKSNNSKMNKNKNGTESNMRFLAITFSNNNSIVQGHFHALHFNQFLQCYLDKRC